MMKKFLISIVLTSMIHSLAVAETVVLSGVYLGKDIFVKNPFANDGVGFCAYEVRVNGDLTTDETHSNAFAIDLSACNLELNEPILIEIFCKNKCGVKIINPSDVAPTATSEIVSLNLEQDGRLVWKTKNETGNLPFIIEQLKWNKWVEIGKVRGSGNGRLNAYSFRTQLHFGENTIRIKQKAPNGVKYSETLKVVSNNPRPVSMKRSRVVEDLEFSAPTNYEIYSEFGVLITTGFGERVPVAHFPRGRYYVNYGNQSAQSIAKK